MQPININDQRLKYPGFFNMQAIKNEISIHSLENLTNDAKEYYLDNEYGRLINPKTSSPYGNTNKLSYYINNNWDVVEAFRVPFRKIPIFKLEDISQIKTTISKLKNDNESYETLIRGQTKWYPVELRSKNDLSFLYGDENSKEPSFHPSFLRSDFNEVFINSLWENQIALMLNDVGIDLSKVLTASDKNKYDEDVIKIKGSSDFTSISLGYAQHYGMPSIGLDLTKDLKVATWFASHKFDNNNGFCTIRKLEDFSHSTLFIFRCPKDTVFSHHKIKPKFINNTRPDRQDAWFCHAGWGSSKNQLASYLVCGFRLNDSVFKLFEPSYSKYLFPSRKEDLVLNFFLEMKENKKGVGEVKRALDKIYYLKE